MKTFALILSLFISLNAFAHGEDKSGPNGGFIKMPAAYHTELVPHGMNGFKVYLLDIEWKNPSVKNSNIELTHVGKTKTKTKAECKVTENFYNCIFPKSVELTSKGQLLVASQRENQKGNEVTYELPLKLKTGNSNQHHQGHH